MRALAPPLCFGDKSRETQIWLGDRWGASRCACRESKGHRPHTDSCARPGQARTGLCQDVGTGWSLLLARGVRLRPRRPRRRHVRHSCRVACGAGLWGMAAGRAPGRRNNMERCRPVPLARRASRPSGTPWRSHQGSEAVSWPSLSLRRGHGATSGQYASNALLTDAQTDACAGRVPGVCRACAGRAPGVRRPTLTGARCWRQT
jgi:hypothetical protein